MTPIRIELAGIPRGKGRPRFSRKNGVAFTDPKTRSYESALRYAAQEAMAGQPLLEGPLSLHLDAYLPIPRSWSKRKKLQASMGLIRPTTKPDVDNLLKSVDALNAVVWHDDAQVVAVSMLKLYSERPRLTIRVAPVEAVLKVAA